MVIEESDFKMESLGDSSPFWDLSLLRTIKSKDNERQEFKPAGYGMTMLSCLQRIANYRVDLKNPESVSLSKYIADYTEQITRLEELTKKL